MQARAILLLNSTGNWLRLNCALSDKHVLTGCATQRQDDKRNKVRTIVQTCVQWCSRSSYKKKA